MKRSEAVKLLEDIFWHHMNCGPDCCEDDKAMYSNILKDIENKIHMLPPTRYWEGTPPLTLEMPVKSNTWDPEDK